jgi:succinate dehydrogenase / fumarate reductase cytochrome b subunit
MVLLGMHLRHGITSAIQSLGLMPQSWTVRILRGGIVLAIVVAGLFAIIPIAVYVGAIR